MTNILILILGLASFANLIADFFTSNDTKNQLPTKPFKCEKCLGFWISIIPFMWTYGFWMGFMYAAITSFMASYIYKQTT